MSTGAFIPGIPVLSQQGCISRLSNVRRNKNNNVLGRTALPRTAATKQQRSVRMAAPLDFDEIAKRLADELKDVSGRTPLTQVDVPPKSADDIGGHFDIMQGNGGIPLVRLKHEASKQTADVYTYGACVTSWNMRGTEILWMSDTNKWEEGGKAIRGGIPLCFPQFGPYGDLVQHGFGRISTWTIHDTVLNGDGSVTAIFTLGNTTEETKKWGYEFAAEYCVTLSHVGLEAKLSVTNTGSVDMPLTFAFHNYFKISSVADTRLFGFDELRYYNRLDQDREMPPEQNIEAGLAIAEETDRIYLAAPEELALFDFNSLRVIKIKKTDTLNNATVWNPYGADGCDPGWNNFVCIEPAVINPKAVIKPGETWVGAQLLGAE